MPIRDQEPANFMGMGLTDSLDQDPKFPGACNLLTNLNFDRTARGALTPRPGVVDETDFTGFTTPGVVSAGLMIGSKIYGMLATGRNPGFDEPFVYDTATEAFVTVSGVTSGNVPATQGTDGDWVPPTLAQIGTMVIVTHPGFAATTNFFGWFDISVPTAPVWNAGNTTVDATPSPPLIALPSRPQAVFNFFGRAYYALANTLVFSEPLLPLSVSQTDEADALICGDDSNITALYGLPIGTTIGGVLQGMLAFKQKSIWQVTGDVSEENLALNEVSQGIGCAAPRSIYALPEGVAFMAADGMRMVNLLSQTPYLNTDLLAPFVNALVPSRAAGCFANGIYRIAVDTLWKNQGYTPADFWYDENHQKWNGPHSFPYALALTDGITFWLASNQIPGKLFRSQAALVAGSSYTDSTATADGAPYNCYMLSVALGEPRADVIKQVIESTIELSNQTLASSYFVMATTDQGDMIQSAMVSVKNQAEGIWGTSIWGQFRWRSAQLSMTPYTIKWPGPIVYKKLLLGVSVQAANFVGFRNLMLRVQPTNRTN